MATFDERWTPETGWPSTPAAPATPAATGTGGGDAPSWEEIVNRVVIPGNPPALQRAADSWQAAMKEIQSLQQSVAGLKDRSKVWSGAGADAFRAYCAGIAAKIKKNYDDHNKVWNALQDCAKALNEAIPKIPISPSFVSQINAARPGSATVPAGGFQQDLLQYYTQLYSYQGVTAADQAKQKADEAYKKGADEAQKAYRELVSKYKTALANMPAAEKAPAKSKGTGAKKPATKTDPTKKPNAANNDLAKALQQLAAVANQAAATPATTTPAVPTSPALTSLTDPSLTSPSLTDPSLTGLTGSGLDPLKDPKFGLASADPLHGAGGAGIPKLGGAGGAGVGGLGSGLPPLGKSVTDLMGGEPGMPGAKGAALAGGAGPGGQATSNTSNMMGGAPHGVGHGGKDGADHHTKLVEEGYEGTEAPSYLIA